MLSLKRIATYTISIIIAIIIAVAIIAMAYIGAIYLAANYKGSLSMVFINKNPSKVVINGEEIRRKNNRYKIRTGYCRVDIEIYFDDKDKPTLLNTFYDNNRIIANMEIKYYDNSLEIKHIKDYALSDLRDIDLTNLTRRKVETNCSVEIGHEISIDYLGSGCKLLPAR